MGLAPRGLKVSMGSARLAERSMRGKHQPLVPSHGMLLLSTQSRSSLSEPAEDRFC